MLAKAAALPADMVLLDLEDAAPAGKTDETRAGIVAALTIGDWAAPTRGVRVNGAHTEWFERDVVAVIEGAGRRG